MATPTPTPTPPILGTTFEDDRLPFMSNIREVDGDTWILSRKIIISRHATEPSSLCWGDGKGAFLTATETSDPPPSSPTLSDGHPFVVIQDWMGSGGQLEIGQAMMYAERRGNPMISAEHTTLEILRKKPWSFRVPQVYYHGRQRIINTHYNTYANHSIYYVIYDKLPGQTIESLYPKIQDKTERHEIIKKVARAQQELATWRGDTMCGADGGDMNEAFLADGCGTSGATPREYLEICREIGMDCSTLVFAHNFMSVMEIVIDSEGVLGLRQWHDAGFVPRDWVRTKLSANLWLQGGIQWSQGLRTEWYQGLNCELARMGFGYVYEEYEDRATKKHRQIIQECEKRYGECFWNNDDH